MSGLSFTFRRDIDHPTICIEGIEIECVYWPADPGCGVYATTELIGWTMPDEAMNDLPTGLRQAIKEWIDTEYAPKWLDESLTVALSLGMARHDVPRRSPFTLRGCGGYR